MPQEHAPSPPDRTPSRPSVAPARQLADFLVILCVSVLVFRTFAAEAYIVPTGSMAPTLLGNHREVVCPNCEFRIKTGLDDEGRGGHALCPNCGQAGLEKVPGVESSGDRVLVQKFLYDVRRPKRWEVAVFHFPEDPSQAYVKRVVGLPGEAVRVAHGDVWIDGQVARKTLKEQRAMRILVYDNNFAPKDAMRYPRWRFRRGGTERSLESGWHMNGSGFAHVPNGSTGDFTDWVDYLHWDPERGRYAPVYDFNSYNGAEVRGENAVTDLMIEAKVIPGAEAKAVAFRIDSGADRFVISIPIAGGETPVVTRNRTPLRLSSARSVWKRNGGAPAEAVVEASVMDRRLTVAIDGVLLFDPIDFDDPKLGPGPGDSPVGIGARGGFVRVRDVRVYRDVYYTSSLAFTPRRPFGVETPYRLGADDFFVLGDNSAVSNDSRFWTESPVVRGELFLGKPFLVHLPGQVVPLEVFGRSLYWVPDPREIRYIR
jgi:signal peptidase I